MTQKKTISIRLDEKMFAEVMDRSKENFRSLNQEIIYLVMQGLREEARSAEALPSKS